jgi:hypothetical protein
MQDPLHSCIVAVIVVAVFGHGSNFLLSLTYSCLFGFAAQE